MNAPSSTAPSREQRTEDRGQRTENRGQRTDRLSSVLCSPSTGLGRWQWFRNTWGGDRSGGHSPRAEAKPIFALARPRRMKQCGRAILFWSLGFYALAALVLNIVMDRWCPAPFEQVYRTKWAELCQLAADAPDQPLVVMLGSSRTDAAFRAGWLDGSPGPDGQPLRAYNFGVPAAGPVHEYLYLRNMLDRGIRPRLLLVEFLPPLFNERSRGLISEENWTTPMWMKGSDVFRMSPYFARPARKRREWLESRLAPWYTHRYTLNNWLQTQLDPPINARPMPWLHDRWGCRCPEVLTPMDRSYRTGVAREYVPTLKHFRLGDGPTRAMRDLVECCRRERIPLALVLTPESAEFQSWYSPKCLTATRDILEELRKTYGVEVIDASQWLADEDFVDGHHVDDSGARKYTTHLLAEVRRILR